MATLTQAAVPVNAARLAKQGDARALLAIPEARRDIPRLIEGARPKTHVTATDFGGRKAISAAKAIVAARLARREARRVAEAARAGQAGRVAAELAARRLATIQAEVGAILGRLYRGATSSWAGGETTNLVTLGESRHASGDTSRAWSRNGKWSGTNLVRRVRVSPTWLRDVHARGLAEVDGLLTTHADAIEAPDGFELFRASWVRQARGMDLRAEGGIIARHVASGTTYHSTATGDDHLFCPGKAISGLRRKLNAQAIPAEVRNERARTNATRRAGRQAASLARLVDRVARFDLDEIAHVVVRREDSIRAGNCGPGTDEFIARFFPDRRRDASATIGEIAARVGRIDPASLRGGDLTLARQLAAACLQAIRKDRAARRLVMA